MRLKGILTTTLVLSLTVLAFQNCGQFSSNAFSESSTSASPGFPLAPHDPSAPLKVSVLDSLATGNTASVVFQLSRPDASDVDITWQTVNDSAVGGVHFGAQSSQVKIVSGQTAAVVSVEILKSETSVIAFKVQATATTKGELEKSIANVSIPGNLVVPPLISGNLLKKLTLGYDHSTTIDSTGNVFSWGRRVGAAGALLVPTLKAIPEPTVELAAGFYHICALSNAGVVRCWGENEFGELGFGNFSTAGVATPTAVPNLAGVKQIASGSQHMCAITAQDTVVCWGANQTGNLGNGTTANSITPVAVSNLAGVKQIALGGSHSCAITAQDTVVCWGSNAQGQLGNNSRTTSTVPVPVANLTGVKQISGGYLHSCALTNLNEVFCWGDNTAGQLGIGNNADSLVPARVTDLVGAKQVASGFTQTCAITAQDTVACWGSNASGRLGNNSLVASNRPVSVLNLTNVLEVTAGGEHNCARTAQMGVQCWGGNVAGQLGNNSTITSQIPVRAQGL